jgi:hypothetical protein
LNISGHNSSTITRDFKSGYIGELWIHGTVNDINGREVTSRSCPLTVHSLEAAFVIGGVILTLIGLIASQFSKK